MSDYRIKPLNFHHLNAHLSEFHSNWHKEDGTINWQKLEAALKPFVSELVSKDERVGDFHHVIDIGQPTGLESSKKTRTISDVFWAVREGRTIPSRFVRTNDWFLPKEITSLVLRGEWRDGNLRLFTIYPATGLAPNEFDPAKENTQETISFWQNHALLASGKEIALPEANSREYESALQAAKFKNKKFYLVPEFSELDPSDVDNLDEWIEEIQENMPQWEATNSVVLCFLFKYADRPNKIYPHFLLNESDVKAIQNDELFIATQERDPEKLLDILIALQQAESSSNAFGYDVYSIYAETDAYGSRWEEADGDSGEFIIINNDKLKYHSCCSDSYRPVKSLQQITGILPESDLYRSVEGIIPFQETANYEAFRAYMIQWCLHILLYKNNRRRSQVKPIFREILCSLILLKNDIEFVYEHPFF